MFYLSREKFYESINLDINFIKENLNNVKIQLTSDSSTTYKLIEKIEQEINLLSKSIKELKNPFLLFIMGSGKYGKSTLVNSLIQKNKLKTKDIPNTWKLDILIGSNVEYIEIIDDCERKLYYYDEGLLILEKEEEKFKSSKKFIKNKFNEIKKDKNLSIYELKEYKKNLEKKYLYKSNIKEVKHYLIKSGVLNDFIIVDTPGLNQNLLKNTKERMNTYYKRADGVLWVIDAKNIVSKKNEDMIKEINENYLLNSYYNNIICVVNKIDEIKNESDLIKIKERTRELYSNYFLDMVFVSSKKAIDGYEINNKELISVSNIEALRESIENNFKKNSEKVQIKSKLRYLKTLSVYLRKLINIYKRNLYEDLYKFDEIKNNLSYEIDNIKIRFEDKIDTCINLANLKNNGIYKPLKTLERLLNLEINNIYLKNKNLKDINIDITKINEVLNIEKLAKNLKNNDKEINLILYERNKLKLNLLKNLDYKLNYIKNDLFNNIEIEFRKKYIYYILVKEHLNQINNIYNILRKWGEYIE